MSKICPICHGEGEIMDEASFIGLGFFVTMTCNHCHGTGEIEEDE